MVCQPGYADMLPGILKPGVNISPGYTSTHGNEVAGCIHLIEVGLLRAVTAVLITAYVNAKWIGHNPPLWLFMSMIGFMLRLPA